MSNKPPTYYPATFTGTVIHGVDEDTGLAICGAFDNNVTPAHKTRLFITCDECIRWGIKRHYVAGDLEDIPYPGDQPEIEIDVMYSICTCGQCQGYRK